MYRRTMAALVVAALAAGCARASWEGSDSLTRDVPQSTDATLAAAASALQAHGYVTQIVNGQLVVTVPKPVPQYTREVSTNPDGTPQLWVVQVSATHNAMRAGTALTVSAFIVPPATTVPDSLQRVGVPVTAQEGELYREVQRIGDWIVERLKSPPND